MKRGGTFLIPAAVLLIAAIVGLLPTASPTGAVKVYAASGIEKLNPAKDLRRAKPNVVYRWRSKDKLRYTWVLPRQYKPGEARNLTVILHGTGLDYRWGHANHPAGTFRPDDIVVAVDGTSAGRNKTRLFLGKKPDARKFRKFLKELRATFSVARVFLYGHSQGGFFVVYFAGEYPDEVDGVVAHASGAWDWSQTGESVHRVALAFLHGTSDPVVPYRQSVEARDSYTKEKFPLVHLRRLERYNHWPNAVRTNEVLSWCEGMTTDDPHAALQAVQSILVPKKPDQYSWRTTVNYAGARQVLRRFQNEGPRPFKKPPKRLTARAKKEVSRINKAANQHIKAILRQLGRKRELRLDGRPWLGHLISLREDFRGVEAVEKLVDSLDYDELLKSHNKAAGRIVKAWYADGAQPADIYRAVIKDLPEAFLYEGFPPNLRKKMEEWNANAEAHGLGPEDTKRFKAFEAWQQGWDEGLKAYGAIWKKWR